MCFYNNLEFCLISGIVSRVFIFLTPSGVSSDIYQMLILMSFLYYLVIQSWMLSFYIVLVSGILSGMFSFIDCWYTIWYVFCYLVLVSGILTDMFSIIYSWYMVYNLVCFLLFSPGIWYTIWTVFYYLLLVSGIQSGMFSDI